MKSGDTNTNSHHGTVEGFEMGVSSGLGLIVKGVSLAGKWGKGPQKGQAHGGTESSCVAGARSPERAWDILAWVQLRGDSKANRLCPAYSLLMPSLAVLKASHCPSAREEFIDSVIWLDSDLTKLCVPGVHRVRQQRDKRGAQVSQATSMALSRMSGSGSWCLSLLNWAWAPSSTG